MLFVHEHLLFLKKDISIKNLDMTELENIALSESQPQKVTHMV